MEFLTKSINFFSGCLQVEIPSNLLSSCESLQGAVSDGKELRIQVTVNRKKRSLNANAALWELLNRMASVLHKTADEVYLDMLELYGVRDYYVIAPQALARVQAKWRLTKVISEVRCQGKPALQVACFYGSHDYDTAEFSRLLDGTIYEAKKLGVDFISAADRDLMLEKRRADYGS